MGKASIPVDLANPGQVFACLGFVEAADALLGEARGGFDWRHDVRFHLESAGDANPVERVLRFLEEAKVVSLAPPGSDNRTEKWGIDTVSARSRAFPFGDPQSPATLPACLRDSDGNSIVIDHWGDETQRTRRDNVKFWAGSGGYPGVGLVRDALDLVRGRTADHIDNPFSLAAEQSSSFRFDWRRDYVPIDAGFSPNAHGDVTMRGYPVVELMAASGLAYARPKRHDKLSYSYGVAGVSGTDFYDPIFLRAALGSLEPLFPGMPFRLFSMRLDYPGQEGQARCITDVIEETLSS